MLNAVALIDAIRPTLFKGSLSTSQAAGIVRLCKAWDAWGNDVDDCFAYILATCWWETGRRMQPVRETFAESDAEAIRRLELAFKSGRLPWVKTPYWRPDENGRAWFGRGDVQLTHSANYRGTLRSLVLRQFGREYDIAAHPDLMLDPTISAYVLIEGMMRRDSVKGDFTSFALEDFVNASHCDFTQARKCVNPGDKSSYAPIAAAAKQWQAALYKMRRAEPSRAVVSYDDVGQTADEKAKLVQMRLRALGYAEVGSADGIMGRRTQAAILAFRNDNGLPLTTEIDEALLNALLEDRQRPIAVERAAATVDDIADKPAVKDALSLESVGKWIGIGGGTAAAASGAHQTRDVLGVMDQATTSISMLQGLIDVARPMLPFLIIAGIGFVVFWFARKLIRRALVGYREGRML